MSVIERLDSRCCCGIPEFRGQNLGGRNAYPFDTGTLTPNRVWLSYLPHIDAATHTQPPNRAIRLAQNVCSKAAKITLYPVQSLDDIFHRVGV